MKHELPPQKRWPHGVHPPGSSSASATPTMEKLAVPGSHPVEQKEVRLLIVGVGGDRELNSNHRPDRPAF